MKYCDLVECLSTLECEWRKNSKEPAEHLKQFIQSSNSSWDFIYFPIDSSTKENNADWPIVVCIGANFADGPDKLPSAKTLVESKLTSCRTRIKNHLPQIEKKQPWKGKICLGCRSEFAKQFAKGEFHLIMMNLSPWITKESWKKVRDKYGGVFLELLARPPHGNFNLKEFKVIKKLLKSQNVLWYGHGNSEVYGLFLHICDSLDLVNWVFDSNLAQKPLKIWRV